MSLLWWVLLPRLTFDRLVQIELVLVCLAAVVALSWPGAARRPLALAWRAWNRLAARPGLAILLPGVLVLLLRLAAHPVIGEHHPAVQDEFSHLLAAQTFAEGRWTNPTHPLWEHFESFHINQRPSYTSMYPPGNAVFLALAIKLAGDPWIAVLVQTALMCSALGWMLLAWLPPRWALLGALVAVLRASVFTYWMNSYYGGSLAALGGALVLGAVPRLWRRRSWRDAVLLGLGVVILANTRSYEGMLTVLGAGVATVVLLGRGCWSWAWRRLGPAVLVAGAGAALMMTYNYKVTGSPWMMPYLVNRETYAVTRIFVWQKLRPEPVYRHEPFQKFYTGNEVGFQRAGMPVTWRQQAARLFEQAHPLMAFYCGPVLLLALAAGITGWRSRRMRPLVWMSLTVASGVLMQTYVQAHYVAPAYGLILAVQVHGLRVIGARLGRAGRRTGLALARFLPLILAGMFFLRFAAGPLGILSPNPFPSSWSQLPNEFPERTEVLRDLTLGSDNHLVIVRYLPGANYLFHEWVYNDPDIDRARVVFAREMDPARNAKLIQYFAGRKIWTLEVTAKSWDLKRGF